MNEMKENVRYDENVSLPRRKLVSSRKKIALQIGIVLFHICFIGYCSWQNDNVLEWLSFVLPVSLLIAFLLWRQRPVWVELYEDKMRYRSLFGKEKDFLYSQMKSIDFVNKIYTIHTFFPVYGYTKYSIYIEEKEKTKKLNMNSLSCQDFITIWETFLEYGETLEEIELCENMKNGYSRRFQVPIEKLKDTYYYLVKRVGIAIAVVFLVVTGKEIFCDLLQNISRMSASECIGNLFGNLLFSLCFFAIFYFPVRYFLFRKEIAASKKVPNKVYVCDEYIEMDGTKYEFDKITNGYVVPSRIHCDRSVQFAYEGKMLQFNFGKYRSFLPDHFKEYRILELYLRGRDFKRWMPLGKKLPKRIREAKKNRK